MSPEKEAVEILMLFAKENCKIMDSGGKDSSVLKRIAEKCAEKYGLEFQVVHNHTSIDAPETVYFIRREREREGPGPRLYNQLSRDLFRPAMLK